MGKDNIEQMLQLLSGKTVKEEVRNNQVVASGGVPFESFGAMQANAPAGLRAGSANATFENREHGTAGVDDVRSDGRIGFQQTGQEASVPISQQQSAARTDEMCKLGVPAAG
jgi:hypothetical protein